MLSTMHYQNVIELETLEGIFLWSSLWFFTPFIESSETDKIKLIESSYNPQHFKDMNAPPMFSINNDIERMQSPKEIDACVSQLMNISWKPLNPFVLHPEYWLSFFSTTPFISSRFPHSNLFTFSEDKFECHRSC